MTFATRHPLAGQVVRTVEQITDAAHESGDTDSAAMLAQECLLAGMPGSAVVVVGEKKRGRARSSTPSWADVACCP